MTPQLREEFRAYRNLRWLKGFPEVHYYGQEGLFNCLVMDLLGSSLEDLFDRCGRKFTEKTVCLLAKQMVKTIISCFRLRWWKGSMRGG